MSETTSRRERIFAAVQARLEEIRVANGYRTDIGQLVLLGEMPKWGENDVDQAIAILPGDDQVVSQDHVGKLALLLPIDIAILLPPDFNQPWRIVEAGLMDVKRVMERDADRDFGGLLRGGRGNPGGPLRGTTESFPRHAGSEHVGAKIGYGLPYWESIGAPEN